MEADRLANEASRIVSGWQKRMVTYDEWGKAFDLLTAMGRYDFPRADAALDRLQAQYARWVNIYGEPQ